MMHTLFAFVALLVQCTLAIDFLQAGLATESDADSMLSAELLAASGHGAAHKDLEKIRDAMSSMYASLPKNSEGLLTHQAVRYALHRHFARQHGWSIRGLEPNNDTWHASIDPDAQIDDVKEWVPTYLQDILEKRLGEKGTDLNQLAALATAMEDLVRKEAKGRLETTYKMYEYPTDKPLGSEEADELILTYFAAFVNWGSLEANTREQALAETKDILTDYPAWFQTKTWLEDLKTKHLVASADGTYAFDNILPLVDRLDEEYNGLNDLDCKDLKGVLSKMQGKKPGRVRLSTFYNKGEYRHWDFADKKEYLKALGVLDETDAAHPSVIITNYLLSRPNCLDASHLFTICCRDECEDLMSSLEKELGGAVAEPERLVQLIASLPSASLFANRELSAELVDKLHDVARLNGGQVPLHGRLFAQWMHHAYPLECPYPHELGAVNPLTRGEWMKESGQESEKASKEEMAEHIESDTCKFDPEGAVVECEGETAEIAWSDKEELLTWKPQRTDSESSGSLWSSIFACALAVVGLVAAVRHWSSQVQWRPLMVTVLLALVAFVIGLLDGTLLFLVLACGGVVVVANQMTAGNSQSQKDLPESKHCV